MDEEWEQLEQFSAQARDRLREVMQELERDIEQWMDRLLRQQSARFEVQVGQTLGQYEQAGLPSGILAEALSDSVSGVFGQGGGESILGRALESAVNRAAGQVARRGTINPRTVLRSGARVAGRAIGNELAEVVLDRSPERAMRYSRAQLSRAAMGEAAHAGR